MDIEEIDKLFRRVVPEYGTLWFELDRRRRERIYELVEDEIRSQFPPGGVAALGDILQIFKFMERIELEGDIFGDLFKQLYRRAFELEEDAIRAELPPGGVAALTDIDQITRFMGRLPDSKDLFQELKRKRDQLREDAVRAVRAELPPGGVTAFTVNDIDRISGFISRLDRDTQLRQELFLKRIELQRRLDEYPRDSPKETDQSLQCKICFERKADVVIQPCKHLICGKDYRTIKEGDSRCPICREPIQGWTSLVEGMEKREDFYRSGGGLKCIR